MLPLPPLPSAPRRPRAIARRAVRVAMGCVIAAGGLGCRDAAPERPTTLASHPRAMDRLARLMRAEFTSPNPVQVEQEIRCEATRVQRALGRDFQLRQRLLLDSLHQEFAAEQFNQLSQRLASAPTPSGDAPACKAINEAAEREVPLKH